jgi:hypothetical protein
MTSRRSVILTQYTTQHAGTHPHVNMVVKVDMNTRSGLQSRETGLLRASLYLRDDRAISHPMGYGACRSVQH